MEMIVFALGVASGIVMIVISCANYMSAKKQFENISHLKKQAISLKNENKRVKEDLVQLVAESTAIKNNIDKTQEDLYNFTGHAMDIMMFLFSISSTWSGYKTEIEKALNIRKQLVNFKNGIGNNNKEFKDNETILKLVDKYTEQMDKVVCENIILREVTKNIYSEASALQTLRQKDNTYVDTLIGHISSFFIKEYNKNETLAFIEDEINKHKDDKLMKEALLEIKGDATVGMDKCNTYLKTGIVPD